MAMREHRHATRGLSPDALLNRCFACFARHTINLLHRSLNFVNSVISIYVPSPPSGDMNAFADDPEQTPLLQEHDGHRTVHAAHPAGLDIEQADACAKERLARQGDGSLYPLSIGVRELGKLGVGIGLYFNFVFYLACILAALSVLSLPSIISNSNGGVAENAVEQVPYIL